MTHSTDVPCSRTATMSAMRACTMDGARPVVGSSSARKRGSEIIAEAMARNGDFAGATGILNALRSAVGLPGHEVPGDPVTMGKIILWERFAEHFMEGYRLIDLHREGLMRDVFEELNDPERPGVDRPSKWPMTTTEPTYNPNINNDLLQRCLPRA